MCWAGQKIWIITVFVMKVNEWRGELKILIDATFSNRKGEGRHCQMPDKS